MGKKKKYACWLCSVPGVGDKTIAKLRQLCPDAEGIYRGGEKLWKQILNEKQMNEIRKFAEKADPDEVFGRLAAQDIHFVSLEEHEYPGRLRDISDPPYGLF